MEVWMPGCSVHAKLLADTAVQEIGKKNLVKARKAKAPDVPGLLRGGAWGCPRRILCVAFVSVTSASAASYPAAESSDVRRRRVGAR